MEKKYHPFHLVENSPWPITLAGSILCLVLSLVTWFHTGWWWILIIPAALSVGMFVGWTQDVNEEAGPQGHHTLAVIRGIRLGFILFIVSEIMFFLSFFWAFFHSSLSPAIEIGMQWPPKGIIPLDPFSIPIMNTALLLSSGGSLTIAHYSLVEGEFKSAVRWLQITIVLGLLFTILQGVEYIQAPFSMADSVYGSVFFIATGFHGIHVIIGTIFLTVCLRKAMNRTYCKHDHTSFELASWYWHFVDVVWIFLFVCIYWWGGI